MQTTLDYRTNRNLFSNHYLKKRLPETEEWNEIDERELKKVYKEIKELYEEHGSLKESYNEDQLERHIIRPTFTLLGLNFETEEKVSRGRRRPDYAFFATKSDQRHAFSVRDQDEDFYRNAVAVGDAKQWGRPLDKRGGNEYDFSNPSFQIHSYLQQTDPNWGVLTNGQKWRLYYGPTSSKLDSYYEIDLPTLFKKMEEEEEKAFQKFKYFYFFFRQEAFVEDTTGQSFLDRVYEGSNAFAQELGDELQDNVYEAIRVLAEGFLKYPENNDLSINDLDRIHESALTYLYRLIFVLYAESEGRHLLDTRKETYKRRYSLTALKTEVCNQIDDNESFHYFEDRLWHRLNKLFRLIDQGSESLGIDRDELFIPAYNGGLFRTKELDEASDEARFLQEYPIGDEYLAEVIHLLTRRRSDETGEWVFVDYSSLDIRHLGSIYEGLLEYKLNVAENPKVAIKANDKTEEWRDAEDHTKDDGEVVERIEEDEVYLTTDKGERKVTGSYYTPEYVVQYIVENTLDPLVEEIKEDVFLNAQGTNFSDAFANRIFSLKIVDPAMGSGHFLTSVVDYLAKEILWAQDKQEEQEGAKSINESHDIHWARRQVAQKCIYGVDLNDMAVELAKVSLWLRTLAAEQPLAFLDHHLKQGNSLIGSNIEDIEELETEENNGGQTALGDFHEKQRNAIEDLMDIYKEFIKIENQDLADAKAMEQKHREIEQDERRGYLIGMMNVHAAEDFGLDIPSDAYERMAKALNGGDENWSEIVNSNWYRKSQETAEKRAFLHWKIQFPEVFYDTNGKEKENPGFDAVIGNPPYVRQEQLVSNKSYFAQIFNTYHGVADLYVYFVEQGINLLKEHGEFGYILSNKFMRAEYGRRLREFILEHSQLEQIIDFGELPVFTDASAFPAILLLEKEQDEEEQDVEVARIKSLSFESLTAAVEGIKYTAPSSSLSLDSWSLAEKKKVEILDKMEESAVSLKEYVDGDIHYGVKTGLNDAFFIDEETRSELVEKDSSSTEVIKPVLKGDDIRRYKIRNRNRYLIFTKHGTNIDEYPAIKEHLGEYRDELEPRPEDYDEEQGEWEGRKPGDYEWYEIQDAVDYWQSFEDTKIIYPVIQKEPRFALDKNGYYANDKCFTIPYNNPYLLALLNSTLIFETTKMKVSVLGDEEAGGRLELRAVHLQNLPIYQIDSEITKEERKPIVENGIENFEKYLSENESKIFDFVDEMLEEPRNDGVLHDLLEYLAEKMTKLVAKKENLNLDILDFIGEYEEGLSLADTGLYQPPKGVSGSILESTTETHEKLQVERVKIDQDSSGLIIYATARYKPENEEKYETDRYGYRETDFIPAMRITNLSKIEAELIEEFVPVAVDKAGGFANFRDNATKNITPVDRLQDLVIPSSKDVEDDLDRYIDVKERAEELNEKIEKADELIDQMVYQLYGLTDEEIKTIEDSVHS